MNDDIIAGAVVVVETVTPRGVHTYLAAHGFSQHIDLQIDESDSAVRR